MDKYDASKGVKFSTYATHFIIGQIKHYLRDKGKIIKEPAWLQELNQRMTRVIESLGQKLGRQPTEKEIGEVMQMPEKTVVELLTTREVFKVGSLDGDKDDSPSQRDTEKISDEKMVTFQLPLEDKIVLEAAMQRLKDIEQQVISEHYYKGHNQTEIAKQLGISCNYVSHILRNGTKKLQEDTRNRGDSRHPDAAGAGRGPAAIGRRVVRLRQRNRLSHRHLQPPLPRAAPRRGSQPRVQGQVQARTDADRYLPAGRR